MRISHIDKDDHIAFDRLYQIQQAAYRVEADLLDVDPLSFFPLKETLRELRLTTNQIFAAFVDSLIVGAVFLETTDTSVVISKLVVDPRFFRKGIAKRLLSHCFNLFPDQEFNVGTGAANVPAIQLYRSFNFEIMREEIVDHSLKILKLRRHSTNVEIGKT